MILPWAGHWLFFLIAGPLYICWRPWRTHQTQEAAAEAGSAPCHHGLSHRYHCSCCPFLGQSLVSPDREEDSRGAQPSGCSTMANRLKLGGEGVSVLGPQHLLFLQDLPSLPCSCSAAWDPRCPSLWHPPVTVSKEG